MHMRKNKNASILTAFTAVSLILGGSFSTSIQAADADLVSKGKKVSFTRKLGNCLACHMMGDGVSPGNIGPPLVAMKARFPDKRALRDRIWDATAINPDSRMPPFGKNRILTEDEIDAVLAYLYTL